MLDVFHGFVLGHPPMDSLMHMTWRWNQALKQKCNLCGKTPRHNQPCLRDGMVCEKIEPCLNLARPHLSGRSTRLHHHLRSLSGMRRTSSNTTKLCEVSHVVVSNGYHDSQQSLLFQSLLNNMFPARQEKPIIKAWGINQSQWFVSSEGGMTINQLNLHQEARIAIASKHALIEARGTPPTLGHQAALLVQVSLLLGKNYIKADERVLQMASILCKASSRIIDLYNDQSEWPLKVLETKKHGQKSAVSKKVVSSHGGETSTKHYKRKAAMQKMMNSVFFIVVLWWLKPTRRTWPNPMKLCCKKGSMEANIVEPKC